MKARYILSMDPSGSFHEGKGTTGLAVMDTVTNKFIYVGFISAHKYECQEEYFNAHLTWIAECMKRYKDDCILSIEDYILYSSNARSHINSHMETSQLIGLIKWFAWTIKMPITIRPAAAVKTRFSDEILEHLGYIYRDGRQWFSTLKPMPLAEHEKDAIRHAVYCYKFELETKPVVQTHPIRKQHRLYYEKLLKEFNESNRNYLTLKHTGDYSTSQRFAAALRAIVKAEGYQMQVTQRKEEVYVSKH